MRIAVFSTPRTCSTFMCDVIANNFNVINHNEGVYSSFGTNKEGKIEWLKLNGFKWLEAQRPKSKFDILSPK